MTSLIVCDFDGTVSRRDIGYNLFHHFSGGRTEELIPEWKAGTLSTRECLRREAAMVTATPEEIYAFLDQFELCAGFAEFVDACRSNGAPLVIFSDGLDFYIEYILKRFGLSDIPFSANRGRLVDGGITVEFPHENRDCRQCGYCKGERIERLRDSYSGPTEVIFIGDGYSDTCATRVSDMIFAKKDLKDYCIKNNVEFC
ncbi:MAG: MtnX-like HAD-IB family phosphatase, partial [candidate division Zixibacteria bacterium]|nr:MtnX-like HAD-IB family phosphatase [candidate division Zixibacteria bacterium]